MGSQQNVELKNWKWGFTIFSKIFPFFSPWNSKWIKLTTFYNLKFNYTPFLKKPIRKKCKIKKMHGP